MTMKVALPDQIDTLRLLHDEATAEQRDQVAASLAASIYLLRWIEANQEAFRLAHKAINDPAVAAFRKAFPDAEIRGIR